MLQKTQRNVKNTSILNRRNRKNIVSKTDEEIKENCDTQKKDSLKRAVSVEIGTESETVKQVKPNESNNPEVETNQEQTNISTQLKALPNSYANQCKDSRELNIDLLDSLQVPQLDACPESLSPTAAFLMSFPVVSASEKRIEDSAEPNEQELLQNEVKQADHINILENISSLLTTRDFERFVSDESSSVIKTENSTLEIAKSVKCDDRKLVPIKELINSSCEVISESKSVHESDSVVSFDFVKPQDMSERPTHTLPKTDRNIPNFAQCSEKPSFTFSLTKTTNSFISTQSTDSGFYDSLSSIGSSSTTNRTETIVSNHHYISNPIMPNLYIHPESTNSAVEYCSKPDSIQTPFTFSLTSTSQSFPSKSSSSLMTTPHSKPITTFAVSKLTNPSSIIPFTKYHQTQPSSAPATIYSQATSYNDNTSANDYNPFSFDNIPAMPMKTDLSQFTFSLTSTTSSTPISTSSFSQRPPSSSVNPFSIDYNILPDQRQSKPSHHTLPFSVCNAITPVPSTPITTAQCFPPKSTSTFSSVSTQNYHQLKATPQKTTQKSNHKSHVNWMTSKDDFTPTAADSLPIPFKTPKHPDISYMHSLEDAFSWSPNKLILDSSTHASLPNLHGDLALNNYVARPHLSSIPSTKRTKKTDPISTLPSNFSVCQLVDQRKSNTSTNNHFRAIEKQKDFEVVDSKTRSKASANALKEKQRPLCSSFNYSSNIFVDSFTNPSHSNKPTITSHSNNYSAESLLSSQCSSSNNSALHKRDKFLSYLPTADFQYPPEQPAIDYAGDSFYPANYLPQKHPCPDNIYLGDTMTAEYTNTSQLPIRTRTQQTTSFHQPHTAHVYPFSSSGRNDTPHNVQTAKTLPTNQTFHQPLLHNSTAPSTTSFPLPFTHQQLRFPLLESLRQIPQHQ